MPTLDDDFDGPLAHRGWVQGDQVMPPGRFGSVRRTSAGLAATAPGVAFAYVDLRTRAGSFAVDWTGHPSRTVRGRPLPQHVEATPLLHVDPTTETVGLGAWPARLGGRPVWFFGTIGADPLHGFGLRYAAPFTGPWRRGQPAEIRIDTNGTHCRVLLDGLLQPMRRFDRRWRKLVGREVVDLPVPRELRRSTCHGFALDSHMTSHRSTPGMTAWRATWRDPRRATSATRRSGRDQSLAIASA